jgi:uncharacterized membrane protein HdeD (DUF308 family)
MAERLSQAAIDAGVTDTREQFEDALARAQSQIAEHWVWYLFLGIVLLLGGCAAIAFPHLSTIAAKIALGWIFLISGVVTVLHAFSAGEWRGFFLNLLIGILYTAAGAYLAFLPLTGILTLTVLVAALFIADGVLELIMAFRIRSHRGWGWVLVSGLVAIAAGALIVLQLPSSATWVLGVLVGIKMIFAGWSFIALALGGHRSDAPTPRLRVV